MFKEISKCIFVVMMAVVHTTNEIYIRRSLTRESDNFLGTDDHTKMIKNDDTRFRKSRYLYISKNGVLHPVINETTVAVHAGYATLIGLGFLSVINAAAKQLSTKSSKNDDKDTKPTEESPESNKANNNLTNSTTKYRRKRKRPFAYTFTTLPPVEPYDDIGNDFDDEVDNDDKHDAEYEEELRQYEKDYEQYLKDYAEWDENYGDLYRNAESASLMVASSSSQVDSTNFRFKQNKRRRKQRYNKYNSERLLFVAIIPFLISKKKF